ncbi:pitrilysin family protein [Sphingomonas sp.]|jgi:zinc protease|uniref:M16 family metallopeptidase n=1 Tax=Sphingomonas sp. TaxID=28214 RepID=UPI002E326F7E|nr:pitrilysin family protein [Sphingomonas sp.]HEX4694345.1 pitrilysin family protein [Sphingomonas sp.]
MRLTRAALLLGVALIPATAGAAPKKAAPDRAATVKPLAYTMRTLANGLRVYAIRDTKTANVSVQVWYNVGSKDDPKGKSGFAHMFEHLMFKATRNLKSENFDRLTEDVGGYNNASTNDDYTNYYEVVPANHLQRLLFAEADRMASLVVEPVSYASERDVVKEELRLRTLATPYGKLYSIYYPEISYRVHPYARPGIGSLENLEAATIDDVRAFHATYYRPDNAVLVVAGNFDPAQLNAWVDQYFAGIKRPDRPIPRVTATEPERTHAASYTVYEPNTPLPAVLISYPIPSDNNADIPALTVLDAILSRGDSSRLYQDLVYRDQLAQSANTFVDTKQGAGNFVVVATMAAGKQVAAGEAALRAEVARVRDGLVTSAELARARNQILTATIESRETADGKASTIARSVIIDGDPAAADEQLAAIARVTPADIQRVARRYLTDSRSAAIRYMPAEMAPKSGAKGDKIAVASTVSVAELKAPADVEVIAPASDAERVPVPDPGKPVVAALPTPITMKLANGMTIIVVEKHDLPLVTASIVANGGGAADPSGRAGLNNLTADLMTKGTRTRSATQIANEVERLGGSISSGAGWDSAEVALEVKSDQIAPALAVLADVTRNPVFAADELERDRAQTIDSVQVQLKNPARIASLAAARVVMGDGPYGHALAGTPTSLKAITRSDVQSAYAATWRPESSTLIMVGDITPAAAKALAERSFGTWRDAGPLPLVPPTTLPPAATTPRIIVVDMPNAGQAGVVVARPGIARSDPDFYAASVANATLGVGFSSRLNQEIRIKRGLAYGAGSGIAARRQPGYVSANTQTKNPSAPEVVGLIIDTMRGMGAAPVPAAELASRKAVLIGDFGRETETTGGIASMIGGYVIENVPLSELKAFTPKIDGVDAATVQRVAQRLLDPTGASIIVVGDAKLFLDDLRKKYPNLEVIPAASVNLDSPTLK